jgi:serine/threonine protein kinase
MCPPARLRRRKDLARWKPARRFASRIVDNRLVESIIVFIVGAIFVVLKVIDKLFRTRLRHSFVSKAHDLSRDQLSIIRKAQIKFLFRKRYRLSHIRVSLAGGSYWLSIPCIVEGTDRKTGQEKKYMGKIINNASALKHRYMTVLRNLGVLASGVDFTFHEHADALDMVKYERDSLIHLREHAIDVPEVYGVHKLNYEDYILVMEFIKGTPLSEMELNGDVADQVFRILKTMHDNGLFHGDIKLDNLLCANGRIVVVDCLKIDGNEPQKAEDFDLICAICALSQQLPVSLVLERARKYHSPEELRRSRELIGIALGKIDLELSEEKIEEIIRGLS